MSHEERLEAAKERLKTKFQLDPAKPTAAVQKGDGFSNSGDYGTATAIYNFVAEIDPTYPGIQEKRLDAIEAWLKRPD